MLGATGRAGRGVARELLALGADVVLVSRDGHALDALADDLAAAGRVRTLVADDLAAATGLIAEEAPSVVVNTVGPFVRTSSLVARACVTAGSHYLDLANELTAVGDVLALDPLARTAGVTVVTGAGFGVLATEALVLDLREGEEAAERARVVAMPAVEALGTAVLHSLIDALGDGGRRYLGGRLVRTRLGVDVERVALPDGRTVTAIGVPTGDVEAARRASGAGDVIAYTSEIPGGPVFRTFLPVLSAALAARPVRVGLHRVVERLRLAPPVRSGTASWAYARLEWPGGARKEAWLSTGEGYLFTARVVAHLATCLDAGDGRAGAYTPGALFGVELARRAGAEIIRTTHIGGIQ